VAGGAPQSAIEMTVTFTTRKSFSVFFVIERRLSAKKRKLDCCTQRPVSGRWRMTQQKLSVPTLLKDCVRLA
jgi:hypothetical protein